MQRKKCISCTAILPRHPASFKIARILDELTYDLPDVKIVSGVPAVNSILQVTWDWNEAFQTVPDGSLKHKDNGGSTALTLDRKNDP